MTGRIPLADLKAQYLSIKTEIDASVASVINESAFVGTSNNRFVASFEQEFAAYVGTRCCVACGNGTDAIEIVLKAAGIGPGDEVLVPALSWIATSEAVTTCGATPVFVDILPRLYSMDPREAAAKITARTKALIPVHLYGLPARMDEIAKLADRHALFVLEDCAQAHGATFNGRQVGTLGHAATYSFFPSKNLGAWGDAGAIVTSDQQLADKARMIARHGQVERKHEHRLEGRNSRLDGIQAAILSAKLRHLPDWTAARRAMAARYRSHLGGVVETMQSVPGDSESVYHLFVLELANRNFVQSELEREGISTAIHYPMPLPFLAAYRRFGYRREDFPTACGVTSRILSLPFYPELTPEQETAVISGVAAAVSRSAPALSAND